jgi:hypothetical protein
VLKNSEAINVVILHEGNSILKKNLPSQVHHLIISRATISFDRAKLLLERNYWQYHHGHGGIRVTKNNEMHSRDEFYKCRISGHHTVKFCTVCYVHTSWMHYRATCVKLLIFDMQNHEFPRHHYTVERTFRDLFFSSKRGILSGQFGDRTMPAGKTLYYYEVRKCQNSVSKRFLTGTILYVEVTMCMQVPTTTALNIEHCPWALGGRGRSFGRLPILVICRRLVSSLLHASIHPTG